MAIEFCWSAGAGTRRRDGEMSARLELSALDESILYDTIELAELQFVLPLIFVKLFEVFLLSLLVCPP